MIPSARDALDAAWLFADLMPEEKDALEPLLRSVALAPGQVLVQEGQAHAAIWIVGDAPVEVHVAGKRVGVLSSGELFGEQAWLEGAPATASIVAAEEGGAWRLSFKEFDKFLDSQTEVHLQILRKLAINLSQRLRRSQKAN